MHTNSVLITQSNYIPWRGYFGSINAVDKFVVYDEMQYTKRDWRNRNRIKTISGLKWLTLPVQVSGKFGQKIKDTKIADHDWNRKHWETIRNTYKSAPEYKTVKPWLEELYATCTYQYLSEINLHFIREINSFLGIKTEILSSSDFDLAEDRNQRLIDICRSLNATDYYSGPSAKNYINETMIENAGINLHYFDYSRYKEYPQLHPPFEHGVSILDVLLNLGEESKQHFKLIE